MHEVIQQVLQAEEQAKRIVDQARAEAERTIATAQQEASAFTASEKQATEAEALRIVNLAVQEGERQRDQELARIKEESDAQIRIEEPVREQAINAAIRCICGAAYERGDQS